MRIMLARKARVGPNTQDRAEQSIGDLFEEDETMQRETLGDTRRSPFAKKYSIVLAVSPSVETHISIVLALERRDGPNTQDQAGRLMAETGHHLEDMIPPGCFEPCS